MPAYQVARQTGTNGSRGGVALGSPRMVDKRMNLLLVDMESLSFR